MDEQEIKDSRQLTEEDLRNMSPEQLAELQRQSCIFCHIVAGRVASRKVYEDEKVNGILDINPANPGHILLLPKKHYMIMPQIPQEEVGKLFVAAKKISHSALKALQTQGCNIFVANGVAAGQKAQHFMIHIIPRKDKDGLKCFDWERKEFSEKEFAKIREPLKKRIKKGLGEEVELEEKEEEKKEMEEEAEEKVKEEEEKEAEVIEEEAEEKAEAEKKGEGEIDLNDIARVLGKNG